MLNYEEDNNNNNNNNKSIILLSIFSLLSFIFILLASSYLIKINVNQGISYSEYTNTNYRVCLIENEDYEEKCLDQGMEYLSLITNNILFDINYKSIYTEKVKTNANYYITSQTKIYNIDDPNKVLYKSKIETIDSKKVNENSKIVDLSFNLDIPFKKYNDIVNRYKNKYSLTSSSYQEIILHKQDDKGDKSLTKILIPLSTQTYGIKINELNNKNLFLPKDNQIIKLENIILFIIIILLIIVFTRFIIRIIDIHIKSQAKKSPQEKKIEQILKEYDRVIIEVKDRVNYEKDKTPVEVDSFNELLDARDTLDRPIIYIKENDSRSLFYVEDNDKLYKLVIGENYEILD